MNLPARLTCLCLLLMMSCTIAFAQQPAVNRLAAAVDSFNVRNPVERVFVHIDRPRYSNTDTIWLKAYLLGSDLAYAERSTLLYTELLNDTGKVVLRTSMPLDHGIGSGQLALDSVMAPEGHYILRAYTNWMQNLGPACFFTRSLYIGQSDAGSYLAGTSFTLDKKEGKDILKADIFLKNLDGSPVMLKPLQVRLSDGGRRSWQSQKLQTDLDGRLGIGLQVPDGANSSRLALVGKYPLPSGGTRTLILPLRLNRPERADVQFMPEGGYLVSGLPSRVGFKALGENGLGINVSGQVLDSKNNIVAVFNSISHGMGWFDFTPLAGETYTARVTVDGSGVGSSGSTSIVKNFALPVAKPSGVVMSVLNLPGRDSVRMLLQRSTDLSTVAATYTLVAQSGGGVSYAADLAFKLGRDRLSLQLPKADLGAGLTCLTLLNPQQQPLAERLLYLPDSAARLKLTMSIQRPLATDTAELNLQATTANGKPLQGSFSVAVTSNSVVKADSTNVADLPTSMLLTGQLKGEVEAPGSYLDPANAEAPQQLEALLLTQGWVAYDWKQVFNPAYSARYLPEKIDRITGKVLAANKPSKDTKVTLFSLRKPPMYLETQTNNFGRFSFEGLPKLDSPAFVLQAIRKKGGVFEPIVELDESTVAPATAYRGPMDLPWYVNSDTAQVAYQRGSVKSKTDQRRQQTGKGIGLKEVIVKGRKVIKGSNFDGGYGAVPDLVLDDKDIIKLRKKTAEEVLRTLGVYHSGLEDGGYVYRGAGVYLAIDGVEIDELYPYPTNSNAFSYYNYIKTILTTLRAEDIKGIEIITKMKMITVRGPERVRELFFVSYIEITTWSGNGYFAKNPYGQAIYRPLPINWPKTFYQPKFPLAGSAPGSMPPTIYWAPNLITDTAGRGKLRFALPKRSGPVTVIVNGADLAGKVGHSRAVIKLP